METCRLTWTNPVTNTFLYLELPAICHDIEEVQSALEQGAVCILDSSANLLFTCFAVSRVDRVQSKGDWVIWPNGLAYTVLNTAE